MFKILLSLIFSILIGICISKDVKTVQKKKASDPNDNRGNTPFFLQDPYDQTCLGPTGFTTCDEKALWMITTRKNKKTYSFVSLYAPDSIKCLQRKTGFLGLFSTDLFTLGSCSSNSAKEWEFEFVDKTKIKLSNNKQCLVRGKKAYKSQYSLVDCDKGKIIKNSHFKVLLSK